MTVKRRPVRKGAMRTLFANVARKKKRQRAATSAPAVEYESDVPNLGIARALVVILIIHVVAIAGIFVHSRWIDRGGEPELAAAEPVVRVPVAEVEPEPLTRLRPGERFHQVGANEDYESIASRYGIAEEDLRKENENMMLRAGRRLRIPEKTIVAVEPERLSEVRGQPQAELPTRPAQPEMPALVETDAALQADARMERPAVAAGVPAAAATGASRYTVRPGDTFWGIARKHGATVDAVMKANGIDDPRRLRAGMELVIPR